MRAFIALTLSLFVIFLFSTFGGVRSPDEEIQFRTAEALAFHRQWSIEQDLRTWPGFGVAQGVDGKRYSVFGPLQPLLLSGWLRFSEPLSKWLAQNAGSLLPKGYYPQHLHSGSDSPERLLSDARRLVGSVFQCLIGALAVGVFFLFVLEISRSPSAAMFAALCLGLATPVWTYSGMFFSEVLSLLFLNLSLLSLARRESLSAGFMLGAGVACHITMLLWVPFLLFFPFTELATRDRVRQRLRYLGGVFVAVAALAWFNFWRFGELLETGRFIGSQAARELGYGELVVPEAGLIGLTIGAGKGLLVYAPVVLLALFFWKPIHRAMPGLSKLILAAVAVRILFIASRSDWHGGFSLGPRLLLLGLPALMIGLAFWYRERKPSLKVTALLFLLLIGQQAFFVSVEVFSMYQHTVAALDARGLDAFAGYLLYRGWQYSPFLIGWKFGPACWWGQLLDFSVLKNTIFLTVFATLIAVSLLHAARKSENTST